MDEKVTRLILALSILIFGLVGGYFFKNKFKNPEDSSGKLLKFAIVFLNPLINLIAIWGLPSLTAKLLLLPLTGFILAAFHFIPAFIFPRLMKYSPKQTGSFILSTLISNIGFPMGGFLCYLFLGQEGYALATIYILYGISIIYTIAFPVARYYGSGNNKNLFTAIKKNFTEPITVIPLLGLLAGFLLHSFKIEYPPEASQLLKYLIPFGTFVMFFAVGMKISLPPIGKFLKLLAALFFLKFIYNPVICQVIVNLFGMDKLYKQVIFIESMMPVGIYALIIAVIFKLDEDTAKAGWIYTTITAIALIPLIFYGLRLF
jgi:predicted permease